VARSCGKSLFGGYNGDDQRSAIVAESPRAGIDDDRGEARFNNGRAFDCNTFGERFEAMNRDFVPAGSLKSNAPCRKFRLERCCR
jgi:hypothetical protein